MVLCLLVSLEGRLILMMTSRERILCVLEGGIPDTVPISPRIAYWLLEQKMTDLELKKVFDYDPIICVGCGLPGTWSAIYHYMQKNFPDSPYCKNVKLTETYETKPGDPKQYLTRTFETPAGSLTEKLAIAPGGREYGMAPNPHYIEHMVKDRSDLEKMNYLLLDKKYFPKGKLKQIDESIGQEGLYMFRPHQGVDAMLADTIGVVNMLLLYYDDRELLKDAIQFYQNFYRTYLEYTLEQGITMLFEAWYNASLSTGWSPDMYRELFLPHIRDNVELTHRYGAYYHFYDDGKVMPVIEDLADAGIDMITTLTPPPTGDVIPEIVKEKIGDRVVLSGYVDLVKMRFGTVEETIQMTKYAIEAMAEGGRFILGTSDSIRDGTPFENVKAYFETGRKYGRYK